MRRKGFKHSKETKEKMSLAQNKQIILHCLFCNKEFKRKKSIIKRGWGKFCSNECLYEDMKKRIPWNKGKQFLHSGSFKKGHKLGMTNKKHSEETKRKISEGNKGKKISEETKRKISLANKGEKSYLWQGGKSFEPYSIDWTETLKRSIRERDNYICQICNQYGNNVHHLDRNKKNCNPNNLITLCQKCHSRQHKKKI